MKKILIIIVLAFISTTHALPPTPASKQSEGVVFHNANIHIGNGQVLKNATLAFENGKISRIGYFRMAWQPGDINLDGKHIYPGFILPNSDIGLTEVGSIKATLDARETGDLNPNVRSLTSYNTDSEKTPTLKFNGILIAQTTPNGGLISGTSSVVQLDAWNWEDAVIKVDDGLHLNWPLKMSSRFDFSTFTVKTEKNKKYAEQLSKIKDLFEQAKVYNKDSDPANLKLEAVSPVFSGKKTVFVHTDDPKAIIESVRYLKSIGVAKVVLIAAQGAEPVIDFIKQENVPVIVSTTHSRPKRDDSPIDNGYNIAVKLHKAGILTSLGYPGSMSARNLPYVAGTVAAYGVDPEQAIQMITGNTAKILGIDKSYGTLEVGKSATLIITEGDVMDMKSSPLTEAYIDGRKIELNGRQQELNDRFLKKYNL